MLPINTQENVYDQHDPGFGDGEKGASDLLRFKIFGMPLPLYAFALITLLLSHFYNAIPTDLVGGFALMFVMGAIFGEIGKRLPIFNKYIGGAPVMIFLVAAYFVYAGIFTQKEIDAISNVMDKSNFLNLFIAVLITGAILSVNRKLLLKSLLGYIPTILAGIVGASLSVSSLVCASVSRSTVS